MKYRNIFWGVLLILLGVLYLLKQFDVIYFNWRDILSLWPLILVLWGISILPVKAVYKMIGSFAAILIMILIIHYNPSRWHSGWIWIGDWDRHDRDRIELKKSEPRSEDAEFAVLELDAAAGTYVIDGTSDDLVDFKYIGDSGSYYMRTTDNGERQKVRIGPEHRRNQYNLYNTHEVELKMNPDMVWDIDLDAGAADIWMDLTPFVINKLTIDGGATSIEIRMGALSDDVYIDIETGVSSVEIFVPEEVACEVSSDSFLVSRELPGFDKVSKSTYVSPNFADATKNITIHFSSGISSLRVVRY